MAVATAVKEEVEEEEEEKEEGVPTALGITDPAVPSPSLSSLLKASHAPPKTTPGNAASVTATLPLPFQ